jgi:hypothetical protein
MSTLIEPCIDDLPTVTHMKLGCPFQFFLPYQISFSFPSLFSFTLFCLQLVPLIFIQDNVRLTNMYKRFILKFFVALKAVSGALALTANGTSANSGTPSTNPSTIPGQPPSDPHTITAHPDGECAKPLGQGPILSSTIRKSIPVSRLPRIPFFLVLER